MLYLFSNWYTCYGIQIGVSAFIPLLVPVVVSLPSTDEMSKSVELVLSSSVVELSNVEKVGILLLVPVK